MPGLLERYFASWNAAYQRHEVSSPQIPVDISPSYMNHRVVPDVLAAMLGPALIPHVRLVAVVRDPVARAYSGLFQSDTTAAHEVFDPGSRTWSVAAPMLKPRSGINSAQAFGCVHVWGGEEQAGVFPDHDYYDPRNDKWTKLPNMAIPIHGVTGATFANGLIYVTGGGTQVGGNSGSLLNQVYRPNVRCD